MPNHPRLRQYTSQHTQEWSARIGRADAIVFVTPDYNYGYPAIVPAFERVSTAMLDKLVRLSGGLQQLRVGAAGRPAGRSHPNRTERQKC
jgi:NAD(P)H-dependent FMN reductase